MTGIQRLRKIIEDYRAGRECDGFECTELSCGKCMAKNVLEPIADQIEREQDAMVADSPYDAILPEDRDAIAWVREHGGLDSVKRLLDWVVGHCSTEQQLDFDFWLSGRVMHELGFEEDMADRDEVGRRLLARLMPDGMCWPVFEDGEPVRIGDVVSDVEVRSVVFRGDGILLSDCTPVPGWGTWRSYKEPINRPEPKVLDADGAEIRAKETVFDKNTGEELIVTGFEDGRVWCEHRMTDADALPVRGMWSPDQLTHERPVLDADGVPIKVGDTVYFTDGREQECNTVVRAKYDYKDEPYVQLGRLNEVGYPTYTNCSCIDPSQLTHERPIADTWERIEEDAGCTATKYNERRGTIFTTKQQVARDLVRRCRALAERERGE